MPWNVARLRAYREYPQSDDVISQTLLLAEADCRRIAPNLEAGDAGDVARFDRAVEQLVQIDLQPASYSGNLDGGTLVNSRNDARNRILSQLVGAATVIDDGRRTSIFPPRYW